MTNFDPNGVGLRNGNLIGLPFDEATARVILLPVPWEATTSYTRGTATGADNIRAASVQLDVLDTDVADAWKMGIFFRPTDGDWLQRSTQLAEQTKAYLTFLENGGNLSQRPDFQALITEVNQTSEVLNRWVYQQTSDLLKQGKTIGLVGGEHSTPLGFLQALADFKGDFGVLQIDAHCDLRAAYEDFTYSHASIFYNALKIKELQKLVQVGIRDFCEEELDLIRQSKGRIEVFYDHQIQTRQFEGETFQQICEDIVRRLPDQVYISFDIDGLDPQLCPHTGTPVPGGLQFAQAMYLLKKVVTSGRKIIGFDLSEVNGEHEWDANVGARVLYKLCNLMGWSNGFLV